MLLNNAVPITEVRTPLDLHTSVSISCNLYMVRKPTLQHYIYKGC